MTSATIAILGAGNMGASLLGGLIKNKYNPAKLWITDTDSTKLERLKRLYQINTSTQNSEAIASADVIILAVKPQIIKQVIEEIVPAIKKQKPLILSIAAGVRMASIEQWAGNTIPLVRVMPNTPALIGCGASVLITNKNVTSEQRDIAESILRAVGLAVWIEDEKLMDVVTALSGSGPAYFFLMMESLQEAATELGLPSDIAKLLTIETAYGAARMALESHDDVVKLRKNVTSPGGTTEQGIKILEQENIRHIFLKTLNAAKQRSEQLAELFDKSRE